MAKVTVTFSVHVGPQAPPPPPALAVTPSGGSLPDETVGSDLGQEKIADISGGTPPYSPQVVNGSLPPGTSLVLDSTGTSLELEGAPTAEGDYSFDVEVDDAGA
jgi:hypothetical protein